MEEANVQAQQKPQEHKAEKPKGPSIAERIKGKIANYKRVIDVARKPTKEDFVSSAKITAFGMVLLGMIGFVIFLIYFLVTK
ncbi:MAG: protein translocase SEC61 complex subunit gamma [Candidatus Aenigmatarchaeota archaeon]